ncbi:MAG: mechanosensitive ion channel family protein [Halobacteriaceae archaeon]
MFALQTVPAATLRTRAEALLAGVAEWLATTGVQALLAVAAVLAGYYLGSLLVRVFEAPLSTRFERQSLRQMVVRGLKTAGTLLGVFVALAVLGLRLGNIVLSVTVFSAVLGLVLAPIVGSVVNGLFLLADQPYEIGDLVELVDRDRRGFVDDITLRYTKIFTLDNTFLVIPNAEMRQRDVINYSAEDERTRLSLDVVVTYEGDLERARRLMEGAAVDVEAVISGGPPIRIGHSRYPARPTCYLDRYGDHGVHLRLRYWARQPYKLLTIRSKVHEGVWDALADADDVTIAYPHSHLVFDETSGRARVEMAGRGPRSGGDSSRPSDRGSRPDAGAAPADEAGSVDRDGADGRTAEDGSEEPSDWSRRERE